MASSSRTREELVFMRDVCVPGFLIKQNKVLSGNGDRSKERGFRRAVVARVLSALAKARAKRGYRSLNDLMSMLTCASWLWPGGIACGIIHVYSSNNIKLRSSVHFEQVVWVDKTLLKIDATPSHQGKCAQDRSGGWSELEARLKRKKVLKSVSAIGGDMRWGKLLGFAADRAPKHLVRYIRSIYLRLLRPRKYGLVPDKGVTSRLKMMTELLKGERPGWLSSWMAFLVDVQVLGGYDTDGNREDPIPDWLTAQRNALANKSPIPPGLKTHIAKAVGEIKFDVSKMMRWEEFVKERGAYMAPGATTLPKVSIEVNGVRSSLRTKETAAAVVTDKEISHRCLNPTDETSFNVPFIKKDEPNKSRVVNNDDFYGFVRTSFLSSVIMGMPSWTCLEKGPGQLNLAYSSMSSAIRQGASGYSLDFSKWDHSLTPEMQVLVLREVEHQILSRLQCPLMKADVTAIVNIEADRLVNRPIKIKNINAGKMGFLSSGHRWTAFFNTIINRAFFSTIEEEMDEERSLLSFHQGDDIAVIRKHFEPSWVKRFAAQASKYGFNLNPLKTSVSRKGVEFLRYWVTADGAFGYPIRALRSLIWRKPVSDQGLVTWLGRIRERAVQIRLAAARGCNNLSAVARGLIVNIIPRVFRSHLSRIMSWVRMPASVGGLGMEVLGGSWRCSRDKNGRGKVTSVPFLESENNQIVISLKSGKWVSKAVKLRVETIVKSEMPVKGINNELRWEDVPNATDKWSKLVDVSSLVPRVLPSEVGNLLERDTPSAFPTWNDGPGWWEARVLGENAFANGLPYKHYLSRRFVSVIGEMSITRSLINWVEKKRKVSVDTRHKEIEQCALWRMQDLAHRRWKMIFEKGVKRPGFRSRVSELTRSATLPACWGEESVRGGVGEVPT